MMSFTLPGPILAAVTNNSSIAESPTATQPIDTLAPWIMMSPPRRVRPSRAACARSSVFG
jgi:hypothetical protein